MGIFCTTTTLDILTIGTTFDSATTQMAEECITQAEEEIRKMMSKRYDIGADAFQTASSTPPMVQTNCKWLSLGYFYENNSRGGKESLKRADRYIDRAMKNLTMIAEYKLDLLNSAGSTISDKSKTSVRVLSNTTNYANTFNEDTTTNWKVDSSKLSDIETERS